MKLTSRMILTASRVFPSFRAHIANRRLMYTRMFVSRPAFYRHITAFSFTHDPVFYNQVTSSSKYSTNKVTIIWAPQSGTSTEGMSRKGQSATGTSCWGSDLESLGSIMGLPRGVRGRAPGHSDFFPYIQIKNLSKFLAINA